MARKEQRQPVCLSFSAQISSLHDAHDVIDLSINVNSHLGMEMSARCEEHPWQNRPPHALQWWRRLKRANALVHLVQLLEAASGCHAWKPTPFPQ